MGFKLEQLLPFLQGKKPKDFPRSKDSKFINKLILANHPDFGMLRDSLKVKVPEFNFCTSLRDAYSETLKPYETYTYDPQSLVHSIPGLIDGFRVAFTRHPLLVQSAKYHQLLYYKNELWMVDARIRHSVQNPMGQTRYFATLVGDLTPPHGIPYNNEQNGLSFPPKKTALGVESNANSSSPSSPPHGMTMVQSAGFRDTEGRLLWLESQVNLHIRLLYRPDLFQEILDAVDQFIQLEREAKRPY